MGCFSFIHNLKYEGAMVFTNYDVFVPSDDQPILQEDEYLVRDLFGVSCYVRQGKKETDEYLTDGHDAIKIGTVNGVIPPDELADNSFAAQFMHATLEIKKSQSNELFLVPMVPQLVPIVNIKDDYIEINPPAGLLDLTYEEKKKRVVVRGFLPASVEINSQLRRELEIASVLVSSSAGITSSSSSSSSSSSFPSNESERKECTEKKALLRKNKLSDVDMKESDKNLNQHDERSTDITEEYLLEKQEKERDKKRKFYS